MGYSSSMQCLYLQVCATEVVIFYKMSEQRNFKNKRSNVDWTTITSLRLAYAMHFQSLSVAYEKLSVVEWNIRQNKYNKFAIQFHDGRGTPVDLLETRSAFFFCFLLAFWNWFNQTYSSLYSELAFGCFTNSIVELSRIEIIAITTIMVFIKGWRICLWVRLVGQLTP